MSSASITSPSRAVRVGFIQPTAEVGGSDIALFRLVTHLDRSRHEPVVFVPRSGPLTAKLTAAGVTLKTVPMMQLRSVRSIGYQVKYAVGFWATVLWLAAQLRRERVQLVHTNSLFAFHGPWAALLAGVPHVWHVREIPDAPASLVGLVGRMAIGLSARVIAMTRAVAAILPTGGRADARVVVLPDGIDLGEFRPGARGERIRNELGIPDGAPLVGFVARLDPWKGADVFVRAAAEVGRHHPGAHFLVCGGELRGYEEYARSLERLASSLQLGDRMHFTGWKYRLDAIPEVMASLDVFVHTSTRPEPFGLVLVEAMASAKPVVAAKDGGVPEVVEDGVTGFLTTPGEPGEAATAVCRLLDEPDLARRMGERGRLRAERLFEVTGYASKVQDLYDEILDRGPRLVKRA